MADTGKDRGAPRWETIAAIVIATAFLIALLAIALFVRNPTPFQIYVFRIVLSLAGGAFAALIPGFLETRLETRLSRTQVGIIRAGGGMAVFFLDLLVQPSWPDPRASESKCSDT